MTVPTTILVTGDRRWSHFDRLTETLAQVSREAAGRIRLLVGDCPTGADQQARIWTRQHGVPLAVFRARWAEMAAEGKPRRAAGPLRNLAMLDALDQADGERLVLAFHDDLGRSLGTRHCVRAARARGYPVTLVGGASREVLPATGAHPASGSGAQLLEVRVGDLFASGAQTLVNPVNTAGVMGAGLAAKFRRRFPDLDADYRRRCAAGQVRLGEPYLYRTTSGVQVVNFPTKGDWRAPSQLADIDRGLAFLASHAADWGITSVAVPALGTGLGGLGWDQVGPLLYQHLHHLGVPVMLYAPPGTPSEQATVTEPAARFHGSAMTPPENRMGLREAALAYARRGIPVVPLHYPVERVSRPGAVGCSCRAPDCDKPGKHPLAGLVPHGVKDATTDPAIIAAWWQRYPYANIGLATGYAFDVLNVDAPAGAAVMRAFAEAQGIALGEGPLARSDAGGWHYYLASTGLGCPDPRGLGHVDWRGLGGLIVAPPSLHPSGRRYRWVRGLDVSLPEVPAALRARLERIPAERPAPGPGPGRATAGRGHPYARTALEGECARVASTKADSRQRNVTLHRAGLRLFSYAAGGLLDPAEVEARLLEAARACGLGEREAAATIRSAAASPRLYARGVPDPPARHRPGREPQAYTPLEERDRDL
jgi:O-acetyl-ADP-ribose deacetylase (regulator of RNase III)